MPALSTRGQNLALLGVLLFTQLLLMAASVRDASGVSRLEGLLVRVTSPIVRLSSAIGGGVRGSWDGLHELLAAKKENQQLHETVGRLQRQQVEMQESVEQNKRLQNMLEMREAIETPTVVARVIHAGLSEHSQVYLIDRGFADGVQQDMSVIGWGGAVGKVLLVEKHFAKVRLLHDPDNRVAARVQRSRARGLLYGEGDAPLTLRFVPVFSDVQPGDLVVTSGLDGVFPAGLTLGWIDRVGEDSAIDKTLSVRPAVNFSELEEVLVLLRPEASTLLRRLAEDDTEPGS